MKSHMRLALLITFALVVTLMVVLTLIGLGTVSAGEAVARPQAGPLAPAATIVVTSTADAGPGTLRQALSDAVSGDVITFDPGLFVPGTLLTITLSSALPDLDQGNLTLDASAAGVVLDGSGLAGGSGLHITSDGNTVKGLHILYFPDNGILLDGGASDNLIGGANGTPGGACSGDCNLISGNGVAGVRLEGNGTTSNTIRGNYIGTDLGGTLALGNQWGGVHLAYGPSGNTIGGTTAAQRNLISGNGDLYCGPPDQARADGDAIWISTNSDGNQVLGNTIGLDVTGLLPLPNARGLEIEGAGTLIEGNLISGNSCDGPPPPRAGVRLLGDGNVARDNTIGPDATGADIVSVHDNGASGIFILGAGNLVEHNVIAGNGGGGGSGVYMWSATAVSNTVTHNAIYSHTLAGISLNNGANHHLFPPLLTEITPGLVKGLAVPGATVELFSDDGDEGRWYHASTPADGAGAFTFTAVIAFTGTNVTATATDGQGNTSQFSSAYHPARDLSAVAIYAPQLRHLVGQPFTPTARVGNGGTAPETFALTAVITRDADGSQVYSATQVVTDLGAFHYRTLALDAWTPPATGAYTFEVTVRPAPADDDPANDHLARPFVVADARVDLWARDNTADGGQEPSSGPIWQSPDVWVRNAADGGTAHQDPLNGVTNTVYVELQNRGTLPATGVEATVYWHPPALVIGQSWWQPIDTVTLAQLAPGASQVVSLAWSLEIPNLVGPYHTCLLGVMTATEDLAPVVWDVRASNNLIQRNVDVIPLPTQPEVLGGPAALASVGARSTFHVGNPYPGEQLVDVVVDAGGLPFTAELRLDLGILFSRWQQMGQGDLVGATVLPGTTQVSIPGGGQAEIRGLPLTGEELVEVQLEMDGLDAGQSVQIDVSERIGGDVLGGITLDLVAESHRFYLPLLFRNRQ